MSSLRCNVLLFFAWIWIIIQVNGESENRPPTMWMKNRMWELNENETVGTKIAQAEGSDPDGDKINYGLEADKTQFASLKPVDVDKLPFRIDPSSGSVYLNESLTGRGGENFLLYVTGNDGQITNKMEVLVTILDTTDVKRLHFSTQFPFDENLGREFPFYPGFQPKKLFPTTDPSFEPQTLFPTAPPRASVATYPLATAKADTRSKCCFLATIVSVMSVLLTIGILAVLFWKKLNFFDKKKQFKNDMFIVEKAIDGQNGV